MVSATELTRTFGEFVAVDRVSFEVAPGEIFGFLGSNGAGKTTVIRMLCGLLKPTSGSGTVAGFDIATQAAEIKTRIGYMSQKFSLYADLTVDENLRFWAGTYRVWGKQFEERREWAFEVTGLGSRRNALVADLPGGFRQRLALSCALLHQPPVVFLDEPTGGVDPEARRRFWDLIDDLSAEGVTVFVTTHYMDEAERCHRVALMHAGKLLALDTIPVLKRVFAPGSVLEIECRDAAHALEHLDDLPEVDRRDPVRESPPRRGHRTRNCSGDPAPPRDKGFRPGEGTTCTALARGRLHSFDPRGRGGTGTVIRRVLATTVKELLQLRRDWRTALALLGMPIVLLMIYGYALSFDVTDIRLGVVDQSRTQASRRLVEAFLKSGYFVQKAVLDDVRPLDDLFTAETIQAALVIPADFASRTSARRPTSILFVLDGSDSQTANTVLGYARQIVASQTGEPLRHRGPGRLSSCPPRLVQPGSQVVDLSGPGPAGLHPHGVVGDRHRAGGGAREGARHHGVAPRDADSGHRAAARQDPALPVGRLRVGGRFALPGLGTVRRAHSRIAVVAGGGHPPVPRRRTRLGDLHIDAGRNPAGGLPARPAVVDAADPAAVGLHLPDLIDAEGAADCSPSSSRPATTFPPCARSCSRASVPRCGGHRPIALIIYASIVLLLATVRMVRSL